ncbi:MAG TPA: hypothetical protein VF505_01895 [Thermoanaerobaculia bacterium]
MHNFPHTKSFGEKQIAQVAKQEAQHHADAAKKAGDKSLAGLVEGFKTMGSVADLVTADIRAARDLGYNTHEYMWGVKGQIMAVSTAAMGDKMAEVMKAGMEQTIAQTKKAYDEATDDATKKMYKDTLDAFEKQKQESAAQKQVDPALAYNKQLVSQYDSALNAFTQEMAKYADKPEDAEKWQKDMDKSIADAKAKAQQ